MPSFGFGIGFRLQSRPPAARPFHARRRSVVEAALAAGLPVRGATDHSPAGHAPQPDTSPTRDGSFTMRFPQVKTLAIAIGAATSFAAVTAFGVAPLSAPALPPSETTIDH